MLADALAHGASKRVEYWRLRTVRTSRDHKKFVAYQQHPDAGIGFELMTRAPPGNGEQQTLTY